MREDREEPTQGCPQDRSHSLVHLKGIEEIAIWEGGILELVSTDLVCTGIDLCPWGGRYSPPPTT
ncbi:TPA: hypothetical protein DCE37_17260 [Candidatus Latescibacteria bacterium]|nr:hypothetical protein [Candidatus Latescibacterota bacterium]|tara:strand:+ start:2716 stop:2910 length:195 start_codon:yes stop_codon:yes gene_type:complete